jgi:hypothetical protein
LWDSIKTVQYHVRHGILQDLFGIITNHEDEPISTMVFLRSIPVFFCLTLTVSAWQPPSRRQWIATAAASLASSVAIGQQQPASAAPPFAIIAEELGYFPVTNKNGQTVNVPKLVKRNSSEQAMELARHMNSKGVKVYETYWCPHSARQRELFGKQAWAIIDHVECAPNGYNAQVKMCSSIDGYPTWKTGKKEVSGERPLSVLAEAFGFPGTFDESLEENPPPGLGSAACKL